jgi:hypothetical protein
MVPLNDEILVAFIVADRLAAAERVRLARGGGGRSDRDSTVPLARSLRSPLIQTGHLLVRIGRWLECLGGECAAAHRRESGQVARA